ncbi:MAG: radical SAM protein [Deltaproteobacteria bacterium]|nr:radical SAM protein [Deltaproteobacteria bacterium]
MRVAFLQNTWEELLGPLTLAEQLEREGHTARFFPEQIGWFRDLTSWKPDLVAMTATTGNHAWSLHAASLIKKHLTDAPPVVLGGPHPTFFPEIVEHPAIDAICRGEAELGFSALVSGTKAGQLPPDVPGFWIKRDDEIIRNDIGPLITDLDQIPFLRREHYRRFPFFRHAPFKRVITSRGCPFKCSYCYAHVYRDLVKGKGSFLRRRSVSHVIEECVYLKRNFKLKIFEFGDDVFTLDKEWFIEFADEYRKKVALPYFAMIHPTQIDDDIADGLKESGCSRVMFGVESGNTRVRREVMNRKIDEEQIRRCAALLRIRGIPFQTFNIVGSPTETIDEALDTLRLNREIRPCFSWCSIAQPYPGTQLEKIWRKEGGMSSRRGGQDAIKQSYFETSVIDSRDGNALANLQKLFGLLVRLPIPEQFVRRLITLPAENTYTILNKLYYGHHISRRNRLGLLYAIWVYLKYRKHY